MAPGAPIGWPPEAMTQDNMCCIEPLLMADDKLNQSPWLATSWDIDIENLVITLKLREGVKFHDGTDFNAKAAKWAMEAYIEAKRAPAWKSVDIIDDYTIKLNLNYWQNITINTLNACIFISPTAYEKNTLDWVRWNPVGTGPFKFESFQRDVSLNYVRFDDYWQEGRPYLDGLSYIYFSDASAMTAAFESGEGQALRMATMVQCNTLVNNKGYDSVCGARGGIGGGLNSIWFDSIHPDSPLSNAKVRMAIEYAIDKEAIASARGYGWWYAAYQPAVYGSNAWDSSLPQRNYDPEKAKQLMVEAGYPDGFKTTLYAQPSFLDQESMVAIQGNLKDIGIDVTLQYPDAGQFNNYQLQGWTGMLYAQVGGLGNNARGMQYCLGKEAYMMTNNVAIPAGYQEALDGALIGVTVDIDKLKEVNKILYEDVTILPIFERYEPLILKPGVVHDSGFFARSNVLDFDTNKVWLSEK